VKKTQPHSAWVFSNDYFLLQAIGVDVVGAIAHLPASVKSRVPKIAGIKARRRCDKLLAPGTEQGVPVNDERLRASLHERCCANDRVTRLRP
jgi:hypothetical protein